MVAHTDLATCTPREEMGGSLLVPASSLDQGAGGDTTKERIHSRQKGGSVWDQFLHNLMLALGAWPI